MENILCPECGELNSADDAFCRRCQTPLFPSLSDGETPAPGPTDETQAEAPLDFHGFSPATSDKNTAEPPMPDWLAEIQDEEPGDVPTIEPFPGPEEIAQDAESQRSNEPLLDRSSEESELPAHRVMEQPVELVDDETAEEVPPFDAFEEAHQALAQNDDYQVWMDELKPNKSDDSSIEPETPVPSQPEEQPQIEKPEWLQALEAGGTLDGRPAGTASEGAEPAGPLAGLVGALPAEPDIIQSFRPSTQSLRLSATDAQQTNAALLRQLIQAEGKQQPVTAAPPRRSQTLLKVVVALSLFAAALYSIITDTAALFPSLTGDTAQVAYQVVESVPTEKPVLVAVDYSPAYASEIGFSLSAVIERLFLRGSYFVFVSTNPIGPVQTQYLMDQLVSRTGMQQLPPHTNLGFLSGQALGIRAFAKDPRQTLPFEILSSPAWQAPPLRRVATISDFGMVVVATENPETAVNWIEQAQPLMKNTPLLMLVSAQIEPIIRPYYDSSPRRMQGMIVGLVNAVQYEKMAGQDWVVHSLWTPVAFSLSIAVLLILLVLFIDSVSAIQARSGKQSRKGA